MPYTDTRSYPYGTRLRHTCRVEVDDNPADPTTIVVYQLDPSGNQTGPFTPTKDATGLYEYVKTYTSATPSSVQGDWTTFWRGTGAAEGGAVRKHHISTLGIASSI